MSVVRSACALSLGFALAICARMYVTAHRPPTEPLPNEGEPGALRSRISPPDDYVAPELSLERPCQEKAEQLRHQLRGKCGVVVHEPFVIAGDSNVDTLERMHCATIEPARQAMRHQYFDRWPDSPVTILLFSDEATYQRYTELLFFDRNISRFGYFKPGRRTILANLAWGDGPLLHELTHVLMHFDFPEAAVWLREGLASLHEASSLVSRGKDWVLEGKVNWRHRVLKRQIQAERLQSLHELIQTVTFDGEDEAINFAQARYFCLFLQQKSVLGEIYRQYRASHREDPRGEESILREFPGRDWRDVDTEFSGWVMSLSNGERTVDKQNPCLTTSRRRR